MKRKIKIGIPRSLLYYRYGILWKTFFLNLNCNVIISPETSEKILIKNNDNKCLPCQLYLSHILYLEDKCDYIIISEICNYGNNNRTCNNLSNMTTYINKFLTKRQILAFNINYSKMIFEFTTMFKMGLKISKNIPKIIYAYKKALEKQKNYNLNKENYQKNLVEKKSKKVLILSHFYNIEEKYNVEKIIKYLKYHDIIPILSSNLNNKLSFKFSNYFPEKIGMKYTKEMIGSYFFYQNIISGIIYITNKYCEVDSLIKNTSLFNNNNIPLINIHLPEDNYQKKLKQFITKLF